MARLVLDETGLLPHANCGALHHDELALLRPVAPSQGMMLESLNPDLDCHRGAPDKAPARRLATLEAAGELQIPFTTGILVGIGESRADRIVALRAIAASHERHGHVQEVIVQNFLPKERTGMRHAPACPTDEELWSIAVAVWCCRPRSTSRRAQPPRRLRCTARRGDRRLGRRVARDGRHVNPSGPGPRSTASVR